MDFYQTPNSDLLTDIPDKEIVQAPLAARLVATFFDLILVFVIDMAMLYIIGQLFSESLLSFLIGQTKEVSIALLVSIMLFSLLGGIVIYTLLNFRLLKHDGQTIGKKLLGIRIVDLQGRPYPWTHIIIKRFVPFWSVMFIPYIGELLFLVNVLPIFMPHRRCLHDWIARSQVVTVN